MTASTSRLPVMVEPTFHPGIEFPTRLKGKRILLGTESFGPVNGVSRTTQSLVQYLRDNGVHVAVVAPKFKGFKPKPATPKALEVRVHGYPLPYSPDLTVAYPLRLDRLCKRTFQPHLVYLASPASLGFQVLLQIRQMESPPTVLLNFQTDLSAYSEIIFPVAMAHYAVWLLRTVQGFLFNHRAVHTIFYPSDGVRQYLSKAGAPDDKMVHLGRGVDTELFSPSRLDGKYRSQLAPNGEVVLVCVGRIALEKGFGFLAQVAQKLISERVDFRLLIVGGNKSPKVEAGVRELFGAMPERVLFAGFQEGAALARCYASGDIFVHCSITETFGLVVLEAMASGLPVVARDAGGPSEIVADQTSGFLTPPNDLDAFVRRVEMLANDKDLRREMAKTSRQMALEKTWEKINNRVAWQLDSALDHQSSCTPRRPIRSWIHAHCCSLISALIGGFRINAAIGLICLIWMIAVVPLLVHGNNVIPRAWHRLRSLPTWNNLGGLVSDQVKLKGR